MKIALIQLSSGSDVAANIKAIESWVEKAAAQGAQLVALPENAFLMERHDAERALFAQEAHEGVIVASSMARAHKVWLLVGSVAVVPGGHTADSPPDKTFNRSLLLNSDGEIVAHYDKIHLFDVEVGDGQVYKESARMLHGGKAAFAETPWGKLGLTVCYDVRFPHLYRALAKVGCGIITVPAAFTEVTGEAHWHVLLRARAIENGCYIVAPAQTGTHPGGRRTFGHSLIVDPWGRVVADGGTEEGVVMADIDLEEVKKARTRIPALMHDRPFDLG